MYGSCFEMSRPFGLQPRPVFAIRGLARSLGHTDLLLLSRARELRHVVYCTAEPPRPPQ